MMPKVIIIFASETGNTADIASKIAEGVRQGGLDPVVKDAFDTDAEELLAYDGILLGSGTTGDGDLPYEALDLYDGLDTLNLRGRLAATFGSGDTAYDLFCGAVDTLEKKLIEREAKIVLPSLKIDVTMSPDEETQALQMGKHFSELLLQEKD
ncbi:flavodoxin domain-containing protein [Sporolactobacillus terrae]|uniref:Flavodoxin n=2 Tax=Sporolactobacillus terrae TaxID=269673 RepID=A0A5K7X0U3_9BACL|nr:flavodoxin domain-containing protein [Sporolactobacillus terrae]BBN98310.1 flavodoxin [Sporolactobacillus terrae]